LEYDLEKRHGAIPFTNIQEILSNKDQQHEEIEFRIKMNYNKLKHDKNDELTKIDEEKGEGQTAPGFLR